MEEAVWVLKQDWFGPDLTTLVGSSYHLTVHHAEEFIAENCNNSRLSGPIYECRVFGRLFRSIVLSKNGYYKEVKDKK